MLKNAPPYSNSSYWDNVVTQYFQGDYRYTLVPDIERQLWEYFKYCLKSKNRFFFENPLISVIKDSFEKNTFVLKKDTDVFRARNDDNHTLWWKTIDFYELLETPYHIQSLESMGYEHSKLEELRRNYEKTLNSPKNKYLKEKLDRGFQGYDAEDCGAPPSEKAKAGRCNSEGVAYLYVAQEEHTAVAEIRPHTKDTISLATLRPKRDLKLVDFFYDEKDTVHGEKFFYNTIQEEFSKINRGEIGEYLSTQYITSLVENLGYDGLRFHSSLVKNGTNYVIFHPQDCEPCSSKICYLLDVQYQYFQLKP